MPDLNEVKRILHSLEASKIVSDIRWRPGDKLRVTEGPFNGFSGVVREVLALRQSLKTSIDIFGVKTPIELHFSQVEKL